jgi:hypothetical protein
MPEQTTPHHPDDPAQIPATVHDTDLHDKSSWQGPTYYGRSQLKAAPFNNWVVGGYVAIAGLSGAAALIAAIADVTEGNAAAPTVRRGRYLSLAAPTIGSLLLIWDLHTPKRFYNMFRIAKRTSPMSIGTWILTAFSTFAMGTAALQALGDHRPGWTWARRLARVTQVPAAISGAGLGTYRTPLDGGPVWLVLDRGGCFGVVVAGRVGPPPPQPGCPGFGGAVDGTRGNHRIASDLCQARRGRRSGGALGPGREDRGDRTWCGDARRAPIAISRRGARPAGHDVGCGLPGGDRRQPAIARVDDGGRQRVREPAGHQLPVQPAIEPSAAAIGSIQPPTTGQALSSAAVRRMVCPCCRCEEAVWSGP